MLGDSVSGQAFPLEALQCNLDDAQQNQLLNLLAEFSGVFAQHKCDLGDFTLGEHHMDTGMPSQLNKK